MFLPSIKSMKIPDLKLQVIDELKNYPYIKEYFYLEIQMNFTKLVRTFRFDITFTIAYFCTRWMS